MTREEIAAALDHAVPASPKLRDAVLALPVLATCEQCTSGEASSSGHMVCADDPRDVQREIERPFAPPPWCPLRGKR